MKQHRQAVILLLALAALLSLLAGCKAESPTAPPPVGSGGTGGTGSSGSTGGSGITQPPVGATVVLTVSNPSPQVDSNVTITARVSLNGQSVPNGTAVEFVTNVGQFLETKDVRAIRITTNNVSTVTLTSTEAGTATVTATVNNVSKSVQVTFNELPVTPPGQSTAPTILSVTPATGPPAGGTVITITGTNFRSPARVLVDAGPAGTKEAFVQAVTPTQIVAVTPAINLTATQTQAASITVIVSSGAANEERATRAAAFTYVTTNLTPAIRFISPTSGPIDGGTRVTITGDGFEQPVQVFFNAAQAQVISVSFNQIIVTSPTARDTNPDASGPKTGPVDVKVLNGNSGKSVVATGGFRYVPHAQITLLGPNEGPFTGGTRFTMDGTGFNEPLTVTLAGVAATIIKVTGTQIIGISNGVVPTGCNDVTGPTVVTNGDNGDSATGPPWIYRVPKPAILSVSSPVTQGGTATVTVANATDPSRILIGGKAASITGETQNANGTTTFTVQVPGTLTLATVACPSGGTALAPASFDVQYTSILSTCTDTMTGGITVNPPAGPILTLVPNGFGIFNATIVAPGGTPPPPPTVTPSAAQSVNIVNTGNPSSTNPTLNITSVTTTGACSHFTLVLPSTPQSLNQCDAAPIVARYNGQTTASSETCTVNIITNVGTRSINLTGVSQ